MSKVIVYRLKNTPAGQKYAVERKAFEELEATSEIVSTWWDSGGTAAVLTQVNGDDDSRYEKPWIDRERIPEAWPGRKGLAAKMIENPDQRPANPVALPTKLIVDDKPKPKVAGCACCGTPWAAADRRRNDLDKTPSGRMANYRCMECGASQPTMTQRSIHMQYLQYQRMLSKVHAQKPKPWNRTR